MTQMKKLHVTELTDGELTAVFQAAAKDAVARVQDRGEHVPSRAWGDGETLAKSGKPLPTRLIRKKAVA